MYQYAKNQSTLLPHSWDTADFRVSRPKRSNRFFITTVQLLAFLNFYQHTKNQFISVIPFCDRANFSVLRPDPLLTMPTPIFFNQLLISINLCQQAKNQAFPSLCYGDIANLKILQSDWPRAFWSISQEPHFSQVWD